MANIQGIDTEYKPWGLTAGAMVGERQADTDAANILSLQESQLANVLKQRDAMEASAQMQNPEWLKWKLAGQIGEGMSKGATGQLDQGVLQDKMDSQIAEFRAKRGEQELNKLGTTLDLVLSSYSANGPLGVKSLQGKIPDELYQYIATNPNSIAELTALSERLKSNRTDTPKLRGDKELKNLEYENQEIIAQGNRESAESIAAANNAARSADRAAQREATQASKDASAQYKEEAEITRRMNVLNSEFKANEVELKRVSEEIASIGLLPVAGKNAVEKEANRNKMKAEKLLEKEALQANQDYLRKEARRIANLSRFGNKSEQGTKDNPIILK